MRIAERVSTLESGRESRVVFTRQVSDLIENQNVIRRRMRVGLIRARKNSRDIFRDDCDVTRVHR